MTDDTIIPELQLCSGKGQYHSNEVTAKHPKPYDTTTIAKIRALVDNPVNVDKKEGNPPWVIFSTLPSRVFKTQEEQGQFAALWADLDNEVQALTIVASVVQAMMPGCQYEIYTSKSAREDYQKSRIIIPLGGVISGADWTRCQKIFNEKLKAAGLPYDPRALLAAQLCYLPNEGDYYNSLSKRDGELFSPLESWANEIEAMAHAEAEAAAAKAAKLEAARVVREERQAEQRRILAERVARGEQPFTGNDLIGAFNGLYSPGDILLQAGYAWDGDVGFRHVHSESGNYSCGLKLHDDGLVKANTLSPVDPLYVDKEETGAQGSGHHAFSCFCVLFHKGVLKDALTNAGDKWVTIGEESWNAVKRREYRKQQAAEAAANSGAAFAEALEGEPAEATTTRKKKKPTVILPSNHWDYSVAGPQIFQTIAKDELMFFRGGGVFEIQKSEGLVVVGPSHFI